jgi:hypothetical protein
MQFSLRKRGRSLGIDTKLKAGELWASHTSVQDTPLAKNMVRGCRLSFVLCSGRGLGVGLYRFVFEDHQGNAGEETVFRLREVEAGDRLYALDAVGGGVDVDVELARRCLEAVVFR